MERCPIYIIWRCPKRNADCYWLCVFQIRNMPLDRLTHHTEDPPRGTAASASSSPQWCPGAQCHCCPGRTWGWLKPKPKSSGMMWNSELAGGRPRLDTVDAIQIMALAGGICKLAIREVSKTKIKALGFKLSDSMLQETIIAFFPELWLVCLPLLSLTLCERVL